MLDPKSTDISCLDSGAKHMLASLAFLNPGRLWQRNHSEEGEMDTSNGDACFGFGQTSP